MKIPTVARVVQYDRTGGPDVLRLQERTLPPPGDGEAVIEVVTAGINHIDAFIREGRETQWDDPFPRGSGSDFAGIVVATGPGAARCRVGAEVIGHVRAGAQATHLVVGTLSLVARPRVVPWEVAGGLHLAGATAIATLDALRIGAGDTVVISAAAGGVGSIEAQVAKHRGARVIGTCGDRNFDYLRQLGIIPVRYGDGIADRIRSHAPDGVHAFIDNFGQDGSGLAEDLGVPPGRFRSSADRHDLELDLLRDDPESTATGSRLLERVVALAGARAFTLLVSGFYPLERVIEAYADLQRMHARGKVVLGTHPVNPYPITSAREFMESHR